MLRIRPLGSCSWQQGECMAAACRAAQPLSCGVPSIANAVVQLPWRALSVVEVLQGIGFCCLLLQQGCLSCRQCVLRCLGSFSQGPFLGFSVLMMLLPAQGQAYEAVGWHGIQHEEVLRGNLSLCTNCLLEGRRNMLSGMLFSCNVNQV
jgi:hypothetical protein